MIKTILKNAWEEVEAVYLTGIICSERHLQAVLYKILESNKSFYENYHCFIEPYLNTLNKSIPEIEGKFPDLVIVDKVSNEIVAVIELKYVPHYYVPFEKDVWNLSLINKYRGNKSVIQLMTEPETGKYQTEGFTISENLLCVFAAITNEFSFSVTDTEKIWKPDYTEKEITNNLTLLGIISYGLKPVFKSV